MAYKVGRYIRFKAVPQRSPNPIETAIGCRITACPVA